MSKTPPPSDLADKFMLRMPEGLRASLKHHATLNKRSMNAEIISRIEASLNEQQIKSAAGEPISGWSSDSIAQQIEAIQYTLNDLRIALRHDYVISKRDASE